MKTDIPFNISNIFKELSNEEFEKTCIETFRYQYNNIEVYRNFIHALNRDINDVHKIEQIPFLPIEFFKNHKILGKGQKHDIIFKSSGTGGMSRSQHYIQNIRIYQQSFETAFELFYGDISNYTVLALLPSYLENGDSSLVYMADQLIKKSNNTESGFYLNDYENLSRTLHRLKNKKILLLGVSYALLDLVEKEQFDNPQMIVMETGGMKGRRKEMLRDELHEKLTSSFGVKKIHSEYGMTELLSQSYSKGDGVFSSPPWMKILIRDTNDPLSYLPNGKSGAINVIDLANIHSVSFIATQDLGKISSSNKFQILGRFDNSDIRGCNLLIA